MRRFVAVTVLFGAFIAACADSSTPPPILGASQADSADQFIVGMEVILHDGGVQRAKILSDTAYSYNANSLMRLLGVHGEFYSSTGVQDAVMTSKRAKYDLRTEALEAYGDVVVVSLDGRRLTTPMLTYDKAENKIRSDSAFKMTSPDRDMQGIGFDSDPGMTFFNVHSLKKASAGTVTVPPKK